MNLKIYSTLSEEKNCLSCRFYEVEDIWYDSMCNLSGHTLNDYFDGERYPICGEYSSKNT